MKKVLAKQADSETGFPSETREPACQQAPLLTAAEREQRQSLRKGRQGSFRAEVEPILLSAFSPLYSSFSSSSSFSTPSSFGQFRSEGKGPQRLRLFDTSIGLDLLHLPTFLAKLQHPKRGEALCRRLFTPEEQEAVSTLSPARRLQKLAGNFACKEAFLKAVGTGFQAGWSWQDLSLSREAGGRPYLNLSSRGEQKLSEHIAQKHQRQLEEAGASVKALFPSWTLSLSHEGDWLEAIVLLNIWQIEGEESETDNSGF